MSDYFITGTDTGVGKTWATLALMKALQDKGKVVVGMKPVASGCQNTSVGWRNND
ncbi:MAG: dethiobiotin synthase, partial [Gammaproteobacteria bacterium]